MEAQDFFKLINKTRFFNTYCPEISNWKHKLRGTDGNKRPIEFSREEKAITQRAAKKIAKQVEKVKF